MTNRTAVAAKRSTVKERLNDDLDNIENENENENENKNSEMVNSAMMGTRALMLFRIFQKFITFLFNQLTISHVDPRVFGVYTIQLAGMLAPTILFLSREGVRLGIYIYMCICIYVCVCVCMYVCMCTSIHAF